MANIESQIQLVEAIQANNESVLQELYKNNFRKIELFVLKNNGTMDHAKDIYQEAFITVWKNIQAGLFSPSNHTAVQGYLYQVARNKWTDFLRSPAYKKSVSLEDSTFHSGIDYLENPSGEEDEKMAIATSAFARLGEGCKTLLTDFYFHKKSIREIAAVLEIDEASTKNKKYRCIQKLREIAFSKKDSRF